MGREAPVGQQISWTQLFQPTMGRKRQVMVILAVVEFI